MGIHLLALVGPGAAAHLRHALAETATLLAVPSSDAFVGALETSAVDMAVIDPASLHGPGKADGLLAIESAFRRHRLIPFFVYTVVDAVSIAALVRLVRLGAGAVLLRGSTDTPTELRRCVAELATATLTGQILAQLDDIVTQLPPPLSGAVTALFDHPDRFASVDALAAAAHITRRTLDRALARAGVRSGRHLLVAARATRAFRLLNASAESCASVAARLGYASERQLSREIALVTGLSPSAARRTLEPAEFAMLASAHIRRLQGSAFDARSRALADAPPRNDPRRLDLTRDATPATA